MEKKRSASIGSRRLISCCNCSCTSEDIKKKPKDDAGDEKRENRVLAGGQNQARASLGAQGGSAGKRGKSREEGIPFLVPLIELEGEGGHEKSSMHKKNPSKLGRPKQETTRKRAFSPEDLEAFL